MFAKLCTLFVLAFTLSQPVEASLINMGSWYEFSWNELDAIPTTTTNCDAVSPFCPGPPAGAVFAPLPPWTFTAPVGAYLIVTDAFLAGDIFLVYDFGVLLGSTSLVGFDYDYPYSCDIDPNPCYADPLMSSGIWFLGPGSHSITIDVDTNPFWGGIGYLRVDAPEPATAILVGAGVFAIWLTRRRAAQSRPRSTQ